MQKLRERIIDPFLAYWEAKRGGRPMPSWRDIDPVEIPALLPYLIVLKVRPDTLDFQYVLAGQEIVTNHGLSPAGRWLSDLAAENPTIAPLMEHFRCCVEQRRPLVVENEFIGRDRYLKRTIRAIAPLSSDGDIVDRLICCVVFKPLVDPGMERGPGAR